MFYWVGFEFCIFQKSFIMKRNRILQILSTIVFTPILVLFVICITVIFIFPLLLYRALISLIAKCFKTGKLYQMVCPISAIMGAEDMTGINGLTSFAALELSIPFPSVEFISNFVQKNGLEAINPETGSLLYPELKECVKPWMGFLFWAKPKYPFDIKNHIYNLEDLNMKHEDWNNNPGALQNCIMDLARKKVWIEGNPFWEFIIISNIPKHFLGPEAVDPKCIESQKFEFGSIILFRMHHILGDGFCIFKFLARVFGFANLVQNVAKPKFYYKEKVGCLQKLVEKVSFMLRIPYDILGELLRSWDKPDTIPKINEDEKGKGSRLVGVVSNDVPLSKIKMAKNIHNVDFTSIFLAMFAGGCRRFLLITKNLETSKLPCEVELAFPLPMPGHPDKLTNHISQGSIRLPIAEPDPVKRLVKIHDRVVALKKSTLPWTTFYVMKILGLLPIYFAKWVRKSTANSAYGPALIFTNLLGPAEPVCLGGPVHVLGLRVGSNAPHDAPSGYCLMVISYNGNARLTMGSLSNYLASQEDAEKLLKACLEELDVLRMDESV